MFITVPASIFKSSYNGIITSECYIWSQIRAGCICIGWMGESLARTAYILVHPCWSLNDMDSISLSTISWKFHLTIEFLGERSLNVWSDFHRCVFAHWCKALLILGCLGFSSLARCSTMWSYSTSYIKDGNHYEYCIDIKECSGLGSSSVADHPWSCTCICIYAGCVRLHDLRRRFMDLMLNACGEGKGGTLWFDGIRGLQRICKGKKHDLIRHTIDIPRNRSNISFILQWLHRRGLQSQISPRTASWQSCVCFQNYIWHGQTGPGEAYTKDQRPRRVVTIKHLVFSSAMDSSAMLGIL